MLENELKIGRQAVLQAMHISRTVQKELAREEYKAALKLDPGLEQAKKALKKLK